MITGSEEYTKNLTRDDIPVINTVIEILKEHSVKNPITSPKLCHKIRQRLSVKNIQSSFPDTKLRAVTNFLRKNAILPVIANSKGYYLSDDPDTISQQAQSLFERASAQRAAAEGMMEYLRQNQKFEYVQKDLFGGLI